MKRTLIALSIAAFAAMASSCIGNGHYTHNRTTNDSFEYNRFVNDFPDSVRAEGFFIGTSGEFVFNVGVDEAKKFTGGFALSAKYDRKLPNRTASCNEYCAYETTDRTRSMFAVYYQNPDPALNPEEKAGIVFLGNSVADCRPTSVQLTNTGLVAAMITGGTSSFEPFKEGDYLRITFVGYKNKVKGTSVSKDLAKFENGSLTLLKEWTEVELTGLGSITTIDVVLESNRADLPLYACMDNFNAQITEEQ